MAISFLRTIVLYVVVVTSMRVMGKRQIGELQPSELVTAIMISELATIPMQDTGIPLVAGIFPIFTLIILEVFSSFFSLKSKRFRVLTAGNPSTLVRNGEIQWDEMKKLRFNEDDLLEELRLCGVEDVNEIKYAILETGGQVSVILKEEHRPVTVDAFRKIVKKERK